MDYKQLSDYLAQEKMPVDLKLCLESLLVDAQNDWTKAHEIVQKINTPDACLIHAYLHRKEGDLSNADYWYHRAKSKRPVEDLASEWWSLVNLMIQKNSR